MPLVTVQVAAAGDSVLARDKIVNTFHLNKEGGPFLGTDWDALAADAGTLFSTLYTGTREIVTKIYDTRAAAPRFPLGSNTRNPGTQNASNGPREVACCLSYYGEHNTPHQRGRMFICATMAAMSAGPRPTIGDSNKLFALADGIAGLGGLDVDWQVYSPTDGQGRNVTNTWCDDEWDTIRSRGLDPTTRTEGTVDE